MLQRTTKSTRPATLFPDTKLCRPPRDREMVAKTVRDILEEAGVGIELVNGFCRIVPVCLVQDYFGLDGVSRSDLIRWSYWNQYDAFNNQPFDLMSDEEYRLAVDLHAQASDRKSTRLNSSH